MGEISKMPWKAIAKLTGAAAVTTATFLIGLAAWGIQEERKVKAEHNRVRWTDANRWDRN